MTSPEAIQERNGLPKGKQLKIRRTRTELHEGTYDGRAINRQAVRQAHEPSTATRTGDPISENRNGAANSPVYRQLMATTLAEESNPRRLRGYPQQYLRPMHLRTIATGSSSSTTRHQLAHHERGVQVHTPRLYFSQPAVVRLTQDVGRRYLTPNGQNSNGTTRERQACSPSWTCTRTKGIGDARQVRCSATAFNDRTPGEVEHNSREG